jgi:exopolyphosphatase/guanosine-5'-triphosphate,3'-diphosphate pyrophosphatase
MLCRFHRKSMPAARHIAFQAMTPADKNSVLFLLPLLRLADSLDRSHSQQIDSVECQIRANSIVIEVKSHAGADLDLWAAERVAEVFREVYGRNLQLAGSRP